MIRVFFLCVLAVFAAVSPAAEQVSFEGELKQGGLVVGQAPRDAQVRVDGRPVSVSPDGRFVFGIGRDAAGPIEVRVEAAGRNSTHSLPVAQREYDIQRIDGLPSNKVAPSSEDLKRIRAEQILINRARARDLARDDYRGQWAWPVTGIITGIYGSQRILNGQPRRPHYGLDVAAPEGTPIHAPAGGVVALAHEDMFFSGNTIIIDHGQGLTSTLIHMNDMHVESGDEVERGQLIGTVGATGRATGPHLHWGVNWFGTRLDPALLLPPMPEE